MRAYQIARFGLEHLELKNLPDPQPGPGEVLLEVQALSLNYRDFLVIQGGYNPSLDLPATPFSDAAGVVAAVGDGVSRVKEGDQVMTQFVAPWIDGPYDTAFLAQTLGTPGPGVAAERVVLSAEAVVPMPREYGFAEASTLPIAALTAWSCLRTVTQLQAGQTMLTLGTGGVAIFALQLAKAMGAHVIITSSSDEKLQRCRELGADHTINYQKTPAWDEEVLRLTNGRGVDVTVDTAGPATLDLSMRSTCPGGTIALPGALTGRKGEVTTGLMLMRRLHIAGILVDSRTHFEDMVRFIEEHDLRPVISNTFGFDELPAAVQLMAQGGHFGKIVVER